MSFKGIKSVIYSFTLMLFQTRFTLSLKYKKKNVVFVVFYPLAVAIED